MTEVNDRIRTIFKGKIPPFEKSIERRSVLNCISNDANAKMHQVSQENSKLLIDAIEDCFQKSGLAQKGYKVVNITPNNVEQIIENSKKAAQSTMNPFKRRRLARRLTRKLHSISSGIQAACVLKDKYILVNMEKFGAAVVHEGGHGLNAAGNIFTKGLQSARQITKLVPIILGIGILMPKNKDNNAPQNKLTKAGNFVKNNAGKLAFATFIPILFEEALASIRGAKLFKDNLPKNVLKQINKCNALYWTTYLSEALIISAGVGIIVKAVDRIRTSTAEKRKTKTAVQN